MKFSGVMLKIHNDDIFQSLPCSKTLHILHCLVNLLYGTLRELYILALTFYGSGYRIVYTIRHVKQNSMVLIFSGKFFIY